MQNTNYYFETMQKYAPVVLRWGMALIFFWFGVNQILNPIQWTSYLPTWTAGLPISSIRFVLMNGWFEIVGATLLVLGVYTRLTAFLLSAHLFGIAFTMGLDAIGMRDVGLAIATGVVFLQGAGPLSVDMMAEQSVINTLS